MSSRLACLSLLLPLTAAAGCGPESWTPPPPAGVTWRYDARGFNDRSVTIVTGSIRGPAGAVAYLGTFAFRDELSAGMRASADPFAESSPIDGVRFNQHLAGQGRPLAPAASATAAPPASASGAAPAAPSASAPAPPGAW